MPQVNPQLLERLISKLGLSKSHVYKLIQTKVSATHLPRELAAIALASDHGLNISRFASHEDLAIIRQASSTAPAPPTTPDSPQPSRRAKRSRSPRPRAPRTTHSRGETVFVVHGRDTITRDRVFAFLRCLGLRPLEWSQALRLVRKGAPYVGEILEAAFSQAAAVVVLLTPDDEARLKPELANRSDPPHERSLTGQARPNVLFEAGMAFGKNPNGTILIQIGRMRPFSDVGGRHLLHLTNKAESRQEFVTKLAGAGCKVDVTGTDWLSTPLTGGDASPVSGGRRRLRIKRK